jgi:hypothetical protein
MPPKGRKAATKQGVVSTSDTLFPGLANVAQDVQPPIAPAAQPAVPAGAPAAVAAPAASSSLPPPAPAAAPKAAPVATSGALRPNAAVPPSSLAAPPPPPALPGVQRVTGHSAPAPAAAPSNATPPKRTVTCQHCHVKGHTQKTCPTKQAEARAAADAAAEDIKDAATWTVEDMDLWVRAFKEIYGNPNQQCRSVGCLPEPEWKRN